MKQIHLTAIRCWEDPNPVLENISINLDDIQSYRSDSRYYNKETTLISYVNGNTVYVHELYTTVRQQIEDTKYNVSRACYVIPVTGGSHYVPVDLVTRFFVNEDNKFVTLYLENDSVQTSMTGVQLKASVIDVNM